MTLPEGFSAAVGALCAGLELLASHTLSELLRLQKKTRPEGWSGRVI
jgi:hypothetical protein